MYYNSKEERVELSVRELCALALRGGDLDNRGSARACMRRGQEGREVHEKFRKLRESGVGLSMETPRPKGLRGSEEALRAPAEASVEMPAAAYHAELPLRHVCRMEGVTFSVSGRADGVWYDPEGASFVEEVKSVTGAAELRVGHPREADLAQLACYGYFLCAAKDLRTVTLRLTYVPVGHEEDAVYVDVHRTAEELRDTYGALLRMVSRRAADLTARETSIRKIAKNAVFPYKEMREPQREMILECWRDMRAGKTLFAEAPTGIGKTIAALYPAVRCWGEGRCDKIFYLTAKNATRREAFGAVEKLNRAGTPIRACVITAREGACLCDAAWQGDRRLSSYCNPDACPYAKGYFDRVEDAIFDLLSGGKKLFSGLDIRATAKKWQICPYELALDLSEVCEIVICDYNYAFSPTVFLRRYFGEDVAGSRGHRYIFLVDEAHNLPDRARDMYSGELSLSDVLRVQDAMHAWESQAEQRIFPEEDAPDGDGPRRRNTLQAASLDDLAGALSRMSRACDETMVTDGDGVRRGVSLNRSQPVVLCDTVRSLSALCDGWLRRNLHHPLYAAVDSLASSLKAFRVASDYFDSRFATFVEVEGEDVRVKLICLDPAGILRPILQKAVARVLFSATLTPNEYFADILGGECDSALVNFRSPFPTDHLCVAICDGVSTRFEDRDRSYRRVLSYISATVSAKRGNYLVYLPSYAYLERVVELFRKKYPTVKTVAQTPGMTYAQREAFIAAFTPDSKELQVGFCVLGGSFSEGVDLPGRCLIGVIVVGVGIPALSNHRNIMREYYDSRDPGGEDCCSCFGGGDGYAYAYTYPGMNHVLQAAGRVIRRDDDYGVVVLIDDRYTAEPYLSLYPEHWDGISSTGDPVELYEYLAEFWKKEKNKK